MVPLASVIIPSFNHARYLRPTLDSVLAQSYQPLEVIVVDDASTDETSALLASYADRVRSVRLDKNSGGPARPRNMALRMAQGDYVSIFDSDDLMQPEKLTRQIAFLDKYRDIPLVFSDFENFEANGGTQRFLQTGHDDFQRIRKIPLGTEEYRILSSDAFNTLVGDNFVGTSGIVMRRHLIDAVGGFDESLSNSDDIDFLFRVSQRFDLGYIDAVLHKRRVHPSNISSRPAATQAKQIVYDRLRHQGSPLSAAATRRLDRKLAEIYLSRGYQERINGNRKLAIYYYLKSWNIHKNNFGIVKSVLRTLLPF